MSSLSPTANRLLVALAAVALAWTTSLPWYAPSGTDPNPTDGPVEQTAWHVARIFSEVAGARTGGDTLLLVAGAVAALVALVLHVAKAPVLGDLLKLLGVVPLALVLIAAVTAPRGYSIHYGVLVAGVAALLLANAALHGAAVRRRRPVGPLPY